MNETPAKSPIACPECGSHLGADSLNRLARCPSCGSRTMIRLFAPAAGALETVEPRSTAEATGAPASVCFHHPSSPGKAVCDLCGRILCEVCRIEQGAKTLCPACIESFSGTGADPEFATRRFRHDELSLWLVILPFLSCIFWFFSIFTAPIAIFLAIRHWRTNLSVAPVSKATFVLAILLALIQIGGLGAIVIAVIWS